MVFPSRVNQAIIFDFDGVIVHSEGAHLVAIREVAQEQGLNFSDETYFREYVALADRELIPRIWQDQGKHLTPTLLRTLLERKQKLYEALVAEGRVVAFAGSVELIREACAQVPIAICSAASRATIEASIHALGIAQCFRTIVTADDVTRSKPDPEPYRLACTRLGLSPRVCVAIEDTVGGMSSALSAGCKVVAVCHTLPAERLGRANLVVAGTRDLTVEWVLGV